MSFGAEVEQQARGDAQCPSDALPAFPPPPSGLAFSVKPSFGANTIAETDRCICFPRMNYVSSQRTRCHAKPVYV